MTDPDIRAAAILALVQLPDGDGYVRASKITWDGKPDRKQAYLNLPIINMNIRLHERTEA